MFGRAVYVDGREYFVMCTPTTPFSEILERASRMAARDEKDQREADTVHKEYRRAVDSI